jgi:hypothetical protein
VNVIKAAFAVSLLLDPQLIKTAHRLKWQSTKYDQMGLMNSRTFLLRVAVSCTSGSQK